MVFWSPIRAPPPQSHQVEALELVCDDQRGCGLVVACKAKLSARQNCSEAMWRGKQRLYLLLVTEILHDLILALYTKTLGIVVVSIFGRAGFISIINSNKPQAVILRGSSHTALWGVVLIGNLQKAGSGFCR